MVKILNITLEVTLIFAILVLAFTVTNDFDVIAFITENPIKCIFSYILNIVIIIILRII